MRRVNVRAGAAAANADAVPKSGAVTTAYLGLGSNLGDPSSQVLAAIAEIDALPRVTVSARSSLYSSPPMGPPDQPDYINAVVEVETSLSSTGLLDRLQAVESAHGRTRDGVHWGPRTLDIDLLLYGDERRQGDRLQLPHPGLKERDFVVLPLFEIAPALVLPDGERLAAVKERLAATAVRVPDA